MIVCKECIKKKCWNSRNKLFSNQLCFIFPSMYSNNLVACDVLVTEGFNLINSFNSTNISHYRTFYVKIRFGSMNAHREKIITMHAADTATLRSSLSLQGYTFRMSSDILTVRLKPFMVSPLMPHYLLLWLHVECVF